MKQRYTSLDLQVIAVELSQTLLNFRLSNIYDISSRIFLLRFAVPNSKHLLLVDSGFRCHLTSFSRTTSPSPSSFVTRLRKHLKTRRLTGVRQLGSDRVLEFTFSEGRYKLYLEFYAGGNVVLVNDEGVCVAVLRIVPAGEDGKGETKVGSVYPTPEGRVGTIAGGEDVTRDMVVEALKSKPLVPEDEEADEAVPPPAPSDETRKRGGKSKPAKKYKKKKGEDTVKRVLSAKITEFSPALIEHALTIVGVNPNIRAEDVLKEDALIDKVVQVFIEAQKVIQNLLNSQERKVTGYIIAKQRKPPVEEKGVAGKLKGKQGKEQVKFGEFEGLISEDEEEQNVPEQKSDEDGYRYDDFHPFLPKQFVDVPGFKVIGVEGYNNTVDTFFSSIESQKLTNRVQDRKLAAIKRLTSARTEHQSRVGALQAVQSLNVRKAQAIEANLEKVEEAIASVNALLSQGVEWKGVEVMIANAKRAGNPVAEIVGDLKLAEGVITLVLSEIQDDGAADEDENDEDLSQDEEESEDEADDNQAVKNKTKRQEKLRIDVNLSLSGWANARDYYNEKKTAAVKEEKTILASTKALKNTERKVLTDLKKGLTKEKQLLRPVRQQVWFEKFYFFISSDGYLVLGGRDPQQTELLYQRHFKRGDVLVSADIEGAAMLIVQNRNPYTIAQENSRTAPTPIPPNTLAQAGTFSICASKAWESKAVMSAWWVNWDQVSKTVKETGDYVVESGKLVIDGVKNYLPPAQLVLGYAVLWATGDKSADKIVTHEEEEGEQNKDGTEGVEGEREVEGEDNENDEEGDEQGEDSDDEEFPDAQIAFGGEDSGKEGALDAQVQEAEVPQPSPEAAEVPPERSTSEQIEEHDEEGTPTQPSQPSGKKHLSAKERKELKSRPGAGLESPVPIPSPAPSNAQPKPPAQVLRGKKNTSKHKKKLAEKYALLSDDEREIARELLGVGGGTTHSGTGTPSVDGTGGKTQSRDAEKKAEEQAERQRKREQHLRAQALGKAAEAKRFGRSVPPGVLAVLNTAMPTNDVMRAVPNTTALSIGSKIVEDRGGGEEAREEEAGVVAPPDDQQDPAVDLTRFTGMPSHENQIVDAIPVCAPYSALGKYKYKMKLVPAMGGQSSAAEKKGKAVKGIIAGWVRLGEPARASQGGKGGSGGGLGKGRGIGMGFSGWDEAGVDVEKVWPREWELLKNWRPEESLNCVPVSRLKVIGGVGEKGEGGKGGKGGGGGGGAKGKGKAGGKGAKGKEKEEGGKGGGKGGKKK